MSSTVSPRVEGSSPVKGTFSAEFIFLYRSGTVNSKSFVGKDLLRIKWKLELTCAF